MGLLTSTVGSFPKSRELRRLRRRFAEGEIEAPELRRAEDRAVREVLALQEEIGLDLLVDGELDRGDMTTFFADGLEGMEIAGLVRSYGNRYYRKPVVVGEIRRTAPLTVERWRSAKAATSKPLKAVLTGPYTLMDWSFNEHYPTREACCMALAEVLRSEVEDLASAGAREIQIDEPAISARQDELDLASRALERVTSAVRGRARTWTHLCYGDFGPVMERILDLPVDGLLLELSNSGFDVVERLRDLPADKVLGAGVVDVHTRVVESRDEIRARVERVLEVVSPERLWINPDCGLKTRTPEEVRGKLSAMVGAVREVRESRGL